MKKLSYLFAVVAVCGFLYPWVSNAQQAQVDIIIDSGIILSIYPSIPGPNQTVNATIESSTVDLDLSNISWSLNGSNQQSGKGLKNFSFTTGGVGSKSVIAATITSAEGTFVKPLTIEIGAVDLLWQGDGYTPPFYKGRTLWAKQTAITFVAIPQVPGSNIIYRWTLDGTIDGNSSGVGRNSFTFNDSILGLPRSVTVDAMKDRDTITARNSINLVSINPSILVYENNPLYGVRFEKEVGQGFSMTDAETSFSAFPLFYWVLNKDSQSMGYQWATNSGDIQNTSTVTYRTPDDASGSSGVTIHAYNKNQILEDMKKSFSIQFNSKSSI